MVKASSLRQDFEEFGRCALTSAVLEVEDWIVVERQISNARSGFPELRRNADGVVERYSSK